MSARSRIEIESHKDPHTLEREIEAKRAEISGTVAALENKLSPGELFERALGLMRGNGREFAENLGASVRNNPVPMLLTSVGLLWMMASQQRGSTLAVDRHGGTYAGTHAGGLGEKTGEMRARTSEKLGHARDAVSGSAHRASDAAHRASQSVRARAGDAREGFEALLREQPLAVGAIGIALGALVGAMLPATEREDELLGSTSDKAREKARQMAQSGLDRTSQELSQRSNGGSANSQGMHMGSQQGMSSRPS